MANVVRGLVIRAFDYTWTPKPETTEVDLLKLRLYGQDMTIICNYAGFVSLHERDRHK